MSNNGQHNKLTQKQERFARFLFDGLTQREAWIKAGYSSNYRLDIVDRNASKLAHKTEIKMRYDELQRQLDEKSIAKKEELMKWHTKLVRAAYNYLCGNNPQQFVSNQIRAAEQLAKLGGYYSQPDVGYQDNRVVNIILQGGEESKEKLERLLAGEKPMLTEGKPDEREEKT